MKKFNLVLLCLGLLLIVFINFFSFVNAGSQSFDVSVKVVDESAIEQEDVDKASLGGVTGLVVLELREGNLVFIVPVVIVVFLILLLIYLVVRKKRKENMGKRR